MAWHRQTVHIDKPFTPQPTREQREKQLLQQRNEPHNRTSFTTYNVTENVLAVDTCNKTLYSDSTIQYNRQLTAADVLKQEQLERRAKKQQLLTNKYNNNVQHENQRWNQMTAEQIADRQRIDTIIEQKQRNHTTTLPYNPITMEYNNTDAGKELLYRDNITKYNSLYRMQQVDLRSNGDLNPITGVANKRIVLPDRPTRPT